MSGSFQCDYLIESYSEQYFHVLLLVSEYFQNDIKMSFEVLTGRLFEGMLKPETF